jgi:hypothetical protein
MASGFKINKQGVRQMTRELEREFAKHPVRAPFEADPSNLAAGGGMTENSYHGPVVTVSGDNAQLVWGANGDITQIHDHAQQIAPGYEKIARSLTDLMANFATLDLGDDETEAKEQAETVLAEVIKPDPDKGVVKRGLTMIKGLLAPISAGVSAGVTAESSHAIDALSSGLPV